MVRNEESSAEEPLLRDATRNASTHSPGLIAYMQKKKGFLAIHLRLAFYIVLS